MTHKTNQCDLHTHSVFSDGTYTPSKIVDEAVKLGIAAVALCDHNTISGLSEFMIAADEKDIEAVPGVEISTEHNGTELHILALFVSPNAYDVLEDFLNEPLKLKEESNIQLVQRLCDNGFDIDYQQIKDKMPGGNVNRANIAAELFSKGYVKSVKDAFRTVLSSKYGLYVPPKRLASLETIEFIKSIGALPVWAHPFLNMTANRIDDFLPIAKARGLVGIETRYSLYDSETERLATLFAEKNGLLESGGSDFHGENKPDIKLGTGKGNLNVPYEFYKKLKEHLH